MLLAAQLGYVFVKGLEMGGKAVPNISIIDAGIDLA